jgi:FkbM family methyltransferase
MRQLSASLAQLETIICEKNLMSSHALRRVLGDANAVCRSASPLSAARWITALAMHANKCAKAGSLTAADQAWLRKGASFNTADGVSVALPGAYTPGAREMYCRNVYLRTGITMPAGAWVVDLGANCGLFAAWAAVAGARVIAVEAQHGFAPLIKKLAQHNGVVERVSVETAVASGVTISGSRVGLIADDAQWSATSHGDAARPCELSVPDLIAKYKMSRIGLLKMDIEGGEFAVLGADENLNWLDRVDQLALEIHPDFGDAPALIDRLVRHGFSVDLRDNLGQRQPSDSKDLEYVYCQIR